MALLETPRVQEVAARVGKAGVPRQGEHGFVGLIPERSPHVATEGQQRGMRHPGGVPEIAPGDRLAGELGEGVRRRQARGQAQVLPRPWRGGRAAGERRHGMLAAAEANVITASSVRAARGRTRWVETGDMRTLLDARRACGILAPGALTLHRTGRTVPVSHLPPPDCRRSPGFA